MADTSIEWTHPPKFRGASWNPTVGCTVVSAGCTNCYAMRMAARLEAMAAKDRADGKDPGRKALYEGTTRKVNGKAVWTGLVRADADALEIPLRTRTPTCWFVNSMSDLFHKDVPDGFVLRVLLAMFRCYQHRFIVLTKRPERMAGFLSRWFDNRDDLRRDPVLARGPAAVRAAHTSGRARLFAAMLDNLGAPPPGAAYPLYDWMEGIVGWPGIAQNVIWGVSVEDQRTADERIPHLLRTPAACRAVSYEPALGPVDFRRHIGGSDGRRSDDRPGGSCVKCGCEIETEPDARPDGIPHVCPSGFPRIDWLIVGGESGPGARPCDVAWVRSAVEQCKAAGVPVFVKQLGSRPVLSGVNPDGARWSADRHPEINGIRDRKGGEPSEWSNDLRVREWPDVARAAAARV